MVGFKDSDCLFLKVFPLRGVFTAPLGLDLKTNEASPFCSPFSSHQSAKKQGAEYGRPGSIRSQREGLFFQ